MQCAHDRGIRRALLKALAVHGDYLVDSANLLDLLCLRQWHSSTSSHNLRGLDLLGSNA